MAASVTLIGLDWIDMFGRVGVEFEVINHNITDTQRKL